MDKEKINVWLKNNVIEEIIKKLEIPCENVTWDFSLPENCFYLSDVIFINIHYNKKYNVNPSECENNCLQLVIKKPGFLMTSTNHIPVASLFHNEILFYKSISNEHNECPRCYYYLEDKNDLNNMIIIMENICTKNYQMCPDKYDIPFEYIISGMETIGKFHAMGYALKTQKPDIFSEIISNIEETRLFPGDTFSKYINLVAMRPVNWLRKQNYNKIFVDLMDNYMSNAFHNIMMNAVVSDEPLAVLCHGDFTRNNIFYRNTNGKIESMLIDFAMLRYASPSTDLSTFLYLSCSNDDRRLKFNEIFHAYHNSLINNLRKKGIDDIEKYSYENMLNDYKRKAMYGYIIALFFTPIMRGLATFDKDNIVNFDLVKSAQKTIEAGGDDLSREFSEILLELRDTGCLNHIINPQENK